MYKTKDKERRKERGPGFYIHEPGKARTEQQSYDLRLQRHETGFDVARLR